MPERRTPRRAAALRAAAAVLVLLTTACSATQGAVAGDTTPAVSSAPASAAVTVAPLPASSSESAAPTASSGPTTPATSRSVQRSSSSATPSRSADPSTAASATAAAERSSRSTPTPTPTPTSSAAPAYPVHHQVVGLGDSVPAASRCGCAGFVTGVAQRLSQRGHAVAAVNLAAPGATSDNLVDDLTDAHERSVIAGSDVVLVEIGANDINFNALYDSDCLGAVSCWKDDLTNLDANVRSILRTLQGLRSSDPAAIAVLGYWNVGEAGDVGAAEGSVYVRNARALTDAVNDVLERDAAAAGTVYVDTYAAFGSDDSTATGLLAADGDHPNAKGHDILAQAVVTALRAAGH